MEIDPASVTIVPDDSSLTQIGGKYHFFDPSIREVLPLADADMRAATKANGKEEGIDIGSSHRTKPQQQAAWDRYQSGQGGLAARPGKSRHEAENGALALDVRNYQKAAPYLKKYGFEQPFVGKGDPVHFQFPGAPGAYKYKPPTDISKARNMVAGDNAVPVDIDPASVEIDPGQDIDPASVQVDMNRSDQLLSDAKQAGQDVKAAPKRLGLFRSQEELDKIHDDFWADVNKLQEPSQEPKTAGEFLTRNLPESAQRAASGLVRLPGELKKSGLEAYDRSRQAGQGVFSSAVEGVAAPVADMAKGIYEQGKEFVKAPVKTSLTDPVGTAMLIGMGKEALKGGPELGKSVEMPKDTAVFEPGVLTEKILVPDDAAVNAKISKAVKPALDRALKTSSGKIRNYADLEKFDESEVNAVAFLAKNKENILNAEGVKGALPESVADFSNAIWQGKKLQWEKIDARRKAAGEAGAKIPTSIIADELEKFASDPAIQDNAPTAAAHAKALAESYKNRQFYTPEEAQKAITTLNQKLQSYYEGGHSTYSEPSVAGVDALAANKLRQITDEEFSKVTGEGYQDDKNLYGSLSKLEAGVAKRAFKAAQRDKKGLIDFTDIYTAGELLTGLATMNPVSIAKSGIWYATKEFIKYQRDPNTLIKNMFKNVDRALKDVPETIDVTPESQKLLPPGPSDKRFEMREPGVSPVSPEFSQQTQQAGQAPLLEYTGKGTSLAEMAAPGQAGMPPRDPRQKMPGTISPDMGGDVGQRPNLFQLAGARPDFNKPQQAPSPIGQAGNLPPVTRTGTPELPKSTGPVDVGQQPNRLLQIAGALPDFEVQQPAPAPVGVQNKPVDLAAPKLQDLAIKPQEPEVPAQIKKTQDLIARAKEKKAIDEKVVTPDGKTNKQVQDEWIAGMRKEQAEKQNKVDKPQNTKVEEKKVARAAKIAESKKPKAEQKGESKMAWETGEQAVKSKEPELKGWLGAVTNREQVFDAMRDLHEKSESYHRKADSLKPRGGAIGVGAADFDETLYGSVLDSYRRAISKGGTPDEAFSIAKSDAREYIQKHNARRSRDVNWQRSETAADSFIEGQHRLFKSKIKETGSEAVKVKEPWEMTIKELSDQEPRWYGGKQYQIPRDKFKEIGVERNYRKDADGYHFIRQDGTDGGLVPDKLLEKTRTENFNAHRRYVEKALSEGKPVHPEVLKDYPDLQPKPETAAKYISEFEQWKERTEPARQQARTEADEDALKRKSMEEDKAKRNKEREDRLIARAKQTAPKLDKTSLKDQKASLLKQVDEAIGALGKEESGPGTRRNIRALPGRGDELPAPVKHSKTVTQTHANATGYHPVENNITFKIGTAEFNVRNDKAALQAFRKNIVKDPISDPPKMKPYPSVSGSLSTRIEGEGVSYYNEYQPKRATVDSTLKYSEKIRNEDIDRQLKTLPKEPKAREAKRRFLLEARKEPIALLTADGFISDKTFAMKPLTKPSGVEVNKELSIKERFNTEGSPAAEIYETKGSEAYRTPLVHIVAGNGAETIINAKYADTIMTAYPNAKIELIETGGVQVPLFVEKGEVVGVVFPRMEDTEMTDYIAEQRKLRKAANE